MASRRAGGKVLPSALGLVLLVGACTGETTPTTGTTGTTAGTTSATIPELTAEGRAQLRARALERAWADFGGYKPPCISADIPPELRAALEGFDPPVEYYDPDEDPLESGEYRCGSLTLSETEWPAPGVVRISAGVVHGYLRGSGKWYYFRWDGTAWADSQPDPGDVTGHTSWAS